MRSLYLSCLFILFIFLVACVENDREDIVETYPDLLSDAEEHYRLYAVGHNITPETLEEVGVSISEINYRETLNVMNAEYPDLELEQSPAYLLLDHHQLVLKTYDYEELISYLNENPRPNE